MWWGGEVRVRARSAGGARRARTLSDAGHPSGPRSRRPQRPLSVRDRPPEAAPPCRAGPEGPVPRPRHRAAETVLATLCAAGPMDPSDGRTGPVRLPNAMKDFEGLGVFYLGRE